MLHEFLMNLGITVVAYLCVFLWWIERDIDKGESDE